MKLLVIGSGGREHALAWKLAQSARVKRIYVAPGNGGTGSESKCENLRIPGTIESVQGQEALCAFARQQGIALTLVGPEAPLTAGIVDRFRAAGLAIIGPDKNAARLEGSKVFSKAFMEKYGVRTAQSRSFSDYTQALDYAAEHFQKTARPLVIKADGLAGGKGVIIATHYAEAALSLASFMQEASLGAAGKAVVLEAFLEGHEVSVLAAVSLVPGKPGTILPFIAARDHKRRFEGGQGPNTGGMGAIAPVPDFSQAAAENFRRCILEPSLRGMEQEGMDYRGFLFFGLMVRDTLCSLLEYNVRLGDPETQALVPLMDFDLTRLCDAILTGRLRDFSLCWKTGAVCAPLAVAGAYPGAYQTGYPIRLDKERFSQTGALLFIAGAEKKEDPEAEPGLYTTGGRVLGVSAWASDPEEAWERAYRAMGAISFEGMAFRTDIGRGPAHS
ncbi:MAG: phosphoribosylamine--glycine ligase [Treponema sp.]|jgi:phosphoribosylamine--glycine ligase|nr:phosphoribosylamine--glycine ligase [Treponema sp.]